MLIPRQAVTAGPLAPGRGKTTWPARSAVFSAGTRPCRPAAGHQAAGPVSAEMRTQHDGPVVIVPDLTAVSSATDAGVARQATIGPSAWPVAGPAREPGPSVPQPPPAWRALAAIDPVEVAIAAVTTGCVVAFGVLQALIVAVGLSLIDTVRRSASPHDAVLGWVEPLGRYADASLHRQARLTPGVVIYRLDDRLFFANARYFKARVHEAIRAAPTPVSWLVFDAEAVTHADSTGLEALTTLATDLRHEGITLVVARLRTRMQEQFQHAGITETIGTENFYPSVHAAVDRFTHSGTGTTGPAA